MVNFAVWVKLLKKECRGIVIERWEVAKEGGSEGGSKRGSE